MAYLIDGNNFIGHTSPHELKDPHSKRELAAKLWIFQKIKKQKICLVFDGPPDPVIDAQEFPEKSMKVLFAHEDRSADSLIFDIITRRNNLKKFFVVSSDREIRSFARNNGAGTLSCEAFNRELEVVLKKHKRHMEFEKKATPPSPLEMEHLIELFTSKK